MHFNNCRTIKKKLYISVNKKLGICIPILLKTENYQNLYSFCYKNPASLLL